MTCTVAVEEVIGEHYNRCLSLLVPLLNSASEEDPT